MNAKNIYSLSLDQITQSILSDCTQTILVQGDMGTGKSSMLHTLAQELPSHTPCYFDCTTKDVIDLALPNVSELNGIKYIEFVLNEEFGLHHGKPVIIMIDEIGKAKHGLRRALTRLLQEHEIGNTKLPEGSIVFATTNLGEEGLGDILEAHARNRVTMVKSRKPTAEEWIYWGVANGVDPAVLGWVRNTPQVMQSFTEVEDPRDNPYIFHPKAQRESFVTPRSLYAASKWVKQRNVLDDETVTALLIGTIGQRAALDMMSFITLADQLPRMQDIKDDPDNALVPTNAAAICMVVYNALSTIDYDWIDAWMIYLDRLDKEAQGLFANGVAHPKYPKQTVVYSNAKFTDWAMKNQHMFATDK